MVIYDEKSYEPIATLPLITFTSPIEGDPGLSERYGTADLIRWGQDGLAFHAPTALFVLRGSIVKDVSNSPTKTSVRLNPPRHRRDSEKRAYHRDGPPQLLR